MSKPTKPAAGKAVAPKQSTALAKAADLSKLLQTDAGAGFEEAGRDAYAIPFLTVLQDLSPQTKKKMTGYIEGAAPGQIFNTVTKKLVDGDEGIWVIPCHWSQLFIEWVPRSKGGGFVAAYPPGHPRVQEGIRQKGAGLLLPNGNELMDTRQHFVLALDEETGRAEGVLLPFKSTGLKISRAWMTQMRSAIFDDDGNPLVTDSSGRPIEPPMFAWMYRLTTEEEANDQGSWHQFVVAEKKRVLDPGLYQQARAFGAAMKSGQAKVDYSQLNPEQQGGGGIPEDLDDNVVTD